MDFPHDLSKLQVVTWRNYWLCSNDNGHFSLTKYHFWG